MNEADPSPAANPLSAHASAGALLRQAREAAGLHIGALSVALKVPVAKLEALESDRLDQLPDAVFARALASSVCRTLKVDPAPVLARLPEHVRPRLQLESSTTDRTSLQARGPLWHAPWLPRLSRPVTVVAGLLVVGAMALMLLPSIPGMLALPGTDAADAPVVPAAPAPAAVMVVPDRPVAATSEPAVTPSPPLVASPLPAAPVLVPALAPGASASAAVVPSTAPVAAALPAGTMVAGAMLLLRARATSWVEVTDAGGTVQLRRNLGAGESVPVAGALPLAVVVGRADAIDVLVRGQSFDLAPLARDNVARFQVK